MENGSRDILFKVMIFVGVVGVLLLIFFKLFKSKFQAVPAQSERLINPDAEFQPIHNESRYRMPYSPPVHPQMEELTVDNVLPASYPPELSNDLSKNLINIPLQYNDPTREQLRSQPILITPYNRIKYSDECY